jgi:hypothetical protein
MFVSQFGIRLMLLVGSTIPRPASSEVMTAITSLQVTSDDDTGDGFQISFSLGKGKLPGYGLLDRGELDIFNRVIIAVVMGVMPEVLIDGVITNHQMSPSNEPGMSTLTVTGKDISQMMDLEETNQQYPNQSDSVIVQRILGKYATYGLIPMLTPTTDTPVVTDRTPRQAETDLRCIRRLAAKNGYVFYVEPVTIGTSRAFWGPKVRSGELQPALSIGVGGATNVSSLSFSEEGLAAASVRASFIESFSKSVVPLPAVPPLRTPPLAGRPTPARRVTLLRDTANQGAGGTARELLSAVTNQPDTMTGDAEVESVRYGQVIRARRLIGVRGAGFAHDGCYYVKRVSHRISRGSYTQSVSLSREGTMSLTPAVRP